MVVLLKLQKTNKTNMKNESPKQAQKKALSKTDVNSSVRNYIKNIQIATLIYWCHKNKPNIFEKTYEKV